MTSAELTAMKRSAKTALSGIWLKAAVATLLYVVILGVASSTYLGELLLAGPLGFGYVLFTMCLVDTGNSDLNMMFKGFDRFVQTLVAGLVMSLAVGLGFMLLIVPGIILALGFSMTYFIMADNAEISGIDALQESWNLMKGHKGDYFRLWLNFIGWWLLCIVTLGIATLWAKPYWTAASLNFYRRIRFGTFRA